MWGEEAGRSLGCLCPIKEKQGWPLGERGFLLSGFRGQALENNLPARKTKKDLHRVPGKTRREWQASSWLSGFPDRPPQHCVFPGQHSLSPAGKNKALIDSMICDARDPPPHPGHSVLPETGAGGPRAARQVAR